MPDVLGRSGFGGGFHFKLKRAGIFRQDEQNFQNVTCAAALILN
jgi:hypothetical protein